MTKTVLIAVVSLACSGTVAAAQSDTPDKNMMNQTVTVTGCVAAGEMSGSYLLTHAMMADAKMMAKDKMAMDKAKMDSKMDKDKMMSDHMMSYALEGGGDYKPHLGHTIEVTGTMEKPMTAMKPMTGMTDKPMKPAVLTVTSMKMISATCPR